MTTPYVGFGNDTLAKSVRLKKGDEVACRQCGGLHNVECGKDEDGKESDLLMFYKCGDESYLAGIAGRSVIGTHPDCSGRI